MRESDGRVFLIDFVHAIIRPKNQEEIYWRHRGLEEWEADAIREFLRRRGLVQCQRARSDLIHVVSESVIISSASVSD